MNSMNHDLLKMLISDKKYDVITEFVKRAYPDETDSVVITEYTGANVRVYKSDANTINVLYPKHANIIQEGAVASAIENGTIFDDAEDVSNTADYVQMTSIPGNAITNVGGQIPKKMKVVVSASIGKMNDDGRVECNDSDVRNGYSCMHDMMNAPEKGNALRDVTKNYLDMKEEDNLPTEIGRSMYDIKKEIENMNTVDFDDELTEDDYNYTGWGDIDEYEKEEPTESEDDPTESDDISDDDNGEISDSVEDDNDNSIESDNEQDEEPTEEIPVDEDPVADDDNISDESDDDVDTLEECDSSVEPVQEEDEGSDSSDSGDADTGSDDAGDSGSDDSGAVEESYTYQEGLFNKRPKKLKPIPRSVVAYITSEMNAIRDSNDQAMLSGYTCAKLELVDFYLTCLDTNDDRYIVPHNKQYLTQMQTDLNRLLTQILRIRPISRQDRVWQVNVNYPEGWRG